MRTSLTLAGQKPFSLNIPVDNKTSSRLKTTNDLPEATLMSIAFMIRFMEARLQTNRNSTDLKLGLWILQTANQVTGDISNDSTRTDRAG